MALLFANNAASTLAADVSASGIGLALAVGDGTLFPEPEEGDGFHVTLVDASGASEIVKVAARSGDVLTVVRGQEGTGARAFPAGSAVELRLTAEAMAALVQREELEPEAANVIKGVRFAAASAGVADHGDPAVRGSLAWVAARIGAGQAEIELPGPHVYRVGRSLTIPASVSLRVRRGAIVQVDWGATLTVDGDLRAGRHAVFAGEGTVAGAFGGAAVLPQWFGAKADGVSDDASALAKALAFPRAFLPAGTYLTSAPLPLVAGASLEGEALDQAYIDWDQDFEREKPTYAGRAAVIQYPPELHGALFEPADGVSLRRLVFRCGQARTEADALFSGPVSHVRMDACRVENLERVFADPTGGSSFGAVTAQACRFVGCGRVFQGAVVDCLVQACVFTTNQRAFELTSGSGLNVIVGNRFEWNDVAIGVYQGRANVIGGNLFDASNETAIRLHATSHVQITGNLFWRNGRDGSGPGKRSHLHFKENAAHNLVTGNVFLRGAPDGSNQAVWPLHLVELESCPDAANIFRDNDTVAGCLDLPVQDPWWSSAGGLILDDVHLQGVGSPGASNDALVEILKRLAFVCAEPVNVHLYEDRNWTAYTDIAPGRITLIGHGQVTLANTTGQAHSLRGLENLTYGQAYSRAPAQMAASGPPGLGYWTQGALVWNSSPASGGPVGWVCVGAGAPGVWKGFGQVA